MGVIWTNKTRTKQPQSPTPTDRRFSLGVWVPNSSGLALNGVSQLSPAASSVISQGMRAVRFNGSSDYQVTGWSGTPSVFSWVIVFKAELAPTTETSEAVVHRDGTSLSWGHGSPAYRGVVTFNSSGTYPKVALLDTTPGVWHTVVCVADGTQIRVWQNGRYCGSDTASGAITAGTWNFGRDAGAINATNYWAGDIALCALSPLAITDGQQLSSNPWQLFAPERRPIFIGAAGANTTGTLSSTLDAATLTGVGAVTRSGLLAANLDAATLTGVGAVTRSGTLAVTLDAATLSGAGTVAVGTNREGTLAVTLDAATLAGIGAVTRSGTLAVTLDNATLAGIGTAGQAVTGTLAVTLDNVTLSGIGAIPATPSQGGGTGTGRNLSRKQKKKLKAVESQEWLKAEETARQLLSDRFTKQTPKEKAEALQTYVESLQPVIEALKALTDQIEDVAEAVEDIPVIETTPHQEILQRFDRLEKKVKSVEELIIILMADL